jgi:DNA polymerase I
MNTLPSRWLDATWIKGDGVTMIKYADESKSIRIREAPIKPYFFIHKEDYLKVSDLIKERQAEVETGDYVSIEGKECVKISCLYPDKSKFSVKALRNDLKKMGIRCFEADIPFIRRVMIDCGITQSPITKKAYLDIEVDARLGFPEPRLAERRIIAISIVGNDGKEWFLSQENEAEMIKEAYSILRERYHLVTAWNWRKFDGLYLENRARKLGLDLNWTPIQDIDVMENYRKLCIWGMFGKSYRLEVVAKEHLGIDHESAKTKISMQELWDSFMGDKKKLREYNLTDARIVRDLDKLLSLTDPYIEISYFLPIFVRLTPFMNIVWDTILLSQLQKNSMRIVLPERGTQSAELLGGHTLSPERGVFRGVLNVDFKNLYPSIMRTFMLSPELVFLFMAKTGYKSFLDENNVPIPEVYREYINFVRGLMDAGKIKEPAYSEALWKFIQLRREWKNRMKQYKEGTPEFMSANIKQASFKLVSLSAYGVAGFFKTRFFNPTFFNAITGMGQYILKYCIRIVENELGYKVKYGDTDSMFIEVPLPLMQICLKANEIAQTIESKLKEHLKVFGYWEPYYCISLEPKNVYEFIMFTGAKKKYRGDTVWIEGEFERKTELVGLEAKRSEVFPLMAKVQLDLQNIIKDTPLEKVDTAIRAYLIDLACDLFQGKYDKDLTISMTLRKEDLDAYDHEDPHVRAARKLKEMGLLRGGDRITWVVVDMNPKMVEEPVNPITKEIPKIREGGYRYYMGRILDMVERMFGVRYLELNKGKKKRVKEIEEEPEVKLEDFFGEEEGGEEDVL